MNLTALKDYVQRLEALPEQALDSYATIYDLLAVLYAVIDAMEAKDE